MKALITARVWAGSPMVLGTDDGFTFAQRFALRCCFRHVANSHPKTKLAPNLLAPASVLHLEPFRAGHEAAEGATIAAPKPAPDKPSALRVSAYLISFRLTSTTEVLVSRSKMQTFLATS